MVGSIGPDASRAQDRHLGSDHYVVDSSRRGARPRQLTCFGPETGLQQRTESARGLIQVSDDDHRWGNPSRDRRERLDMDRAHRRIAREVRRKDTQPAPASLDDDAALFSSPAGQGFHRRIEAFSRGQRDPEFTLLDQARGMERDAIPGAFRQQRRLIRVAAPRQIAIEFLQRDEIRSEQLHDPGGALDIHASIYAAAMVDVESRDPETLVSHPFRIETPLCDHCAP